MFWDLITYKIFVNDRFYRYLWIFLIRFYQTGFKKVSHMVFILKGGQFSMFKIVLNLKCCLRDDRILKVTFKQNLLKRDLPSELGYFNISDQNYTLIHLSTKLLFESHAGLCKCYNWIYKSICDLSMCKFKIYILLIAKCLKHVKFMKHLYCLKT